MPGRSLAVCREIGCAALTRDKSRRCPAHQQTAWRRYTPTIKRTSGVTLQKQRRALFKANPLCRHCEQAGLVTLATIRDHIIPLTEGGSDEVSNTQGLCVACHDIKTREESIRGRQRTTYDNKAVNDSDRDPPQPRRHHLA